MSFLGAGVLGFGEMAAVAMNRSNAMRAPVRSTPPSRSPNVKRKSMRGLGASPNITQGTRAWWNWYATQYLAKNYSPSQVQQIVQQSPYYTQYGSPFTIQQTTYPVQGYTPPYTAPQQYVYPQQPYYPSYGYNNTNPFYGNPYGQAQYTQWQAQQGAAACQQQGGYFDYAQQSCNAVPSQPYSGTAYGPATTPPNVIGMTEMQAIQVLNGAGFSVWELSRDGIGEGAPPGYANNRVSISVSNGIVNGSAVG